MHIKFQMNLDSEYRKKLYELESKVQHLGRYNQHPQQPPSIDLIRQRGDLVPVGLSMRNLYDGEKKQKDLVDNFVKSLQIL